MFENNKEQVKTPFSVDHIIELCFTSDGKTF